MLKLLLLISLILNLHAFNRKFISILPENVKTIDSEVHLDLESILNYYGYYVSYEKIEDISENEIKNSAGIISWNSNQITNKKRANQIMKALLLSKNKKIILIGLPPEKYVSNYKNKLKEIGIDYNDSWSKNSDIVFSKYYSFEQPIFIENSHEFIDIHSVNPAEVFLKRKSNNVISDMVFTTDNLFFSNPGSLIDFDTNKWKVDPFKIFKQILKEGAAGPIPDTTTINGKRIMYIHVDGDGILSNNFRGKSNIEEGYLFFKKHQDLKIGISFIAMEINNKNKTLVRKISNLKNVEMASHTYSHPFSWQKGLVAYSEDKTLKKKKYGEVWAYQEKNGKINLNIEVDKSIKIIESTTGKKVSTLYWSGDCYPSFNDLEYLYNKKILAFNGGDTRFDNEFNSYLNVPPKGIWYSDKIQQIFSSDSNENTFTDLWTDNFWKFSTNIDTFKNTGYPKRIKAVDLYFHFYSFEKRSSLNSLNSLYKYLYQNEFENIYPSEFIKIVHGFYSSKIEKISNKKYLIKNTGELRDFRIEGIVKIRKTKDILSVKHNRKLNCTYVRLSKNHGVIEYD